VGTAAADLITKSEEYMRLLHLTLRCSSADPVKVRECKELKPRDPYSVRQLHLTVGLLREGELKTPQGACSPPPSCASRCTPYYRWLGRASRCTPHYRAP
jgi:hypothetical protein